MELLMCIAAVAIYLGIIGALVWDVYDQIKRFKH